MRKKILGIVSVLALLPAASQAAPTLTLNPSNPLRGLFVGAGLGFGALITNENAHPSTRDGADVTQADISSPTGAGITGSANSTIGFDIPVTDKTSLEPSFNFNWYTGKETVNQVLPSQFFNDGDVSLKNKTELQYQLNMSLNIEHLLSRKFAIGANLGFSFLSFNNKLTPLNLDNNIVAADRVFTRNRTTFGPLFGLNLQWLLSKHSSFRFNFNTYLYFKAKLATLDPIVTNELSSLTQRKETIFMPSVNVEYDYHFSG